MSIQYQNHVIVLGRGRAVSAAKSGERWLFALKEGGAVTVKGLTPGERQVAYRSGNVISYATAVSLLPGGGRFERGAEIRYEPDAV